MVHLLGGIVLLRIASSRTFFRYLAGRAGCVRLWLRKKDPARRLASPSVRVRSLPLVHFSPSGRERFHCSPAGNSPEEIEERHGRKTSSAKNRNRAGGDQAGPFAGFR